MPYEAEAIRSPSYGTLAPTVIRRFGVGAHSRVHSMLHSQPHTIPPLSAFPACSHQPVGHMGFRPLPQAHIIPCCSQGCCGSERGDRAWVVALSAGTHACSLVAGRAASSQGQLAEAEGHGAAAHILEPNLLHPAAQGGLRADAVSAVRRWCGCMLGCCKHGRHAPELSCSTRQMRATVQGLVYHDECMLAPAVRLSPQLGNAAACAGEAQRRRLSHADIFGC